MLLSGFPALLRGFINTLLLGLVSIGIGVPAGLLISLVRLYAPRPFRYLAIGYIDIFRAMPMLVVLILIYYALPFVGIRLSSWASAVTAFSIVLAAYSAEVFRSGIESIPKGQFEAALALGLPFMLTLRKVILPQAVRVVIPPTTSNCVRCSRTRRWPQRWRCRNCSRKPTTRRPLRQPFAADRCGAGLCRSSCGRWSVSSACWSAA